MSERQRASRPAREPVEAVLFDLDDTLFLQEEWLDGAWAAVAAVAAVAGADRERMLDALRAVAAAGSAQGRIIDRALGAIGRRDLAVGPFLAAFRAHAPRSLRGVDGAVAALDHLGARVPLGLVTDGDPDIQRAKLAAIGIADRFTVSVFSDELGRAWRKPHPRPLLTAVRRLGTTPARAVYVGDNPAKDTAAAHAAGLRAVRVRTGEYARAPDTPIPWATLPAISGLVDLLGPHLSPRAGSHRR